MIQNRVSLGKYVTEYSVRNKANEDIPVYSVTNSQGFCTEYFDKEVAIIQHSSQHFFLVSHSINPP